MLFSWPRFFEPWCDLKWTGLQEKSVALHLRKMSSESFDIPRKGKNGNWNSVSTEMPPSALKLKPAESLTRILVKFVASSLHSAAKVKFRRIWTLFNLFFVQVCVKLKRARSKLSSEKLDSCRKYFAEVSNCVPANLYEEFMANLQSLILAEKSLLDEIYYDAIGSLLNQFTTWVFEFSRLFFTSYDCFLGNWF